MFKQDIFSALPKRTGEIKKVFIKEKLQELGYPVEMQNLGLFDEIGELTAKKKRSPDSDLYRSAGAYFRPNYERGLLIYSLIKKYNVKSYLEIGFGRGYSCFCAAMALAETGGQVVTVDPFLDENLIQQLKRIFPNNWVEIISFQRCTSDNYFLHNNNKFDMIYIDGDHRYDFVKRDWENSRERFEKLVLFDDYHLPGKRQKDIEVSSLIDSIEDYEKQLVLMDRRIFLDDRGYKDSEIDYGQVILTKNESTD